MYGSVRFAIISASRCETRLILVAAPGSESVLAPRSRCTSVRRMKIARAFVFLTSGGIRTTTFDTVGTYLKVSSASW
jgi:hypothetical protein